MELDTRCIWVIRESMINQADIDTALVYAYQAGYDKLFVQVRGRGDAFYESSIVNKHPDIDKNFDPLKYTIEFGHQLGLEIHAWVNTYILWSNKSKPIDKDHLLYTHSDWTEADIHGKMDWRIDLKSIKSPQWEGIYLSPLHPDVNQYLREVFKEIIDNYEIDGLHMDYIRFQDDFYGYNPAGRESFNKEFNIDPRNIVRGIISTRYGWKQAFVDSMHIAWDSFRQKSITELVEFIREDIDNSGKEIQLSAAVKPNINTAKSRWFQDWQYWLETGLIDIAIPMNYFKEIKDFNLSVQIMKNSLSRDDLKDIIMGISTYNQDAQSAADKILISRLNGFKGVCVFSYDSHKNNLDWFQPVLEALSSPFE